MYKTHRRKAFEVYWKRSVFEKHTWTNFVGVECFTAIHSVLDPNEAGHLLTTKRALQKRKQSSRATQAQSYTTCYTV